MWIATKGAAFTNTTLLPCSHLGCCETALGGIEIAGGEDAVETGEVVAECGLVVEFSGCECGDWVTC